LHPRPNKSVERDRTPSWERRPETAHREPLLARAASKPLHALRVKIGDDAFYAATREWLTRHDDSTGTTEDFQAVCEEASGQDLDSFFDVWVRTPSKPTTW
jgi:CubicO group peptidase (beta-lactamase class C family)